MTFYTTRLFYVYVTDGGYGGTNYDGGYNQNNLNSIETVYTTEGAAAIKRSNHIVNVIGGPEYGGSCGTVCQLLQDSTTVIDSIYTTHAAFAAVTTDGSLLAWGNSEYGGDATSVSAYINATSGGSNSIVAMTSNYGAFSCLLHNGMVLAWGSITYGGFIPSAVSNTISKEGSGVLYLYASKFGFAVVDSKYEVHSWWQNQEPEAYIGEPPTDVVAVYGGTLYAGLSNNGSSYSDVAIGLPTNTPTLRPTISPSLHPSRNPTAQPTSSPSTRSPTSKPTVPWPTSQPSHKPSKTPTRSPTAPPTSQPTSEPTRRPVSIPTSQPTSQPSSHPTKRPQTAHPTVAPTDAPTMAPTGRPTSRPSSKPSYRPTLTPTSSPTSMPTSLQAFDMGALRDLCAGFECSSNPLFNSTWNFTTIPSPQSGHDAFDKYYHDPCSENWYGVSCSTGANADVDKRVSMINLTASNVKGSITQAVDKLVNLELFDLSNNEVSGTIPQTMGALTKLQTLRLDNNMLTGVIDLCGLATNATTNVYTKGNSGLTCYLSCWMTSETINSRLHLNTSTVDECEAPTSAPTGAPTGTPTEPPLPFQQ